MTAATEVPVPDIGDFSDVPIIEIHVSTGDRVNAEDPLVTLESDKATMDVPAPLDGEVVEVLVSEGDRVSEGTPIVKIEPGEGTLTSPPSLLSQHEPEPESTPTPSPATAPAPATAAAPDAVQGAGPGDVHAGPGVRRAARELDVDLSTVTGTGPKGRITKDDLIAALSGPGASAGAVAAGTGIPEIPAQDFAQFGPVQTLPLSRIKRLSGPFLHRSWLNLPHVTHHDEADITDLEAYRKQLDTDGKAAPEPYRVTLLAFLVKAAVATLKEFPEVNSSLSPDKDALIVKDYYHIGIAVDTPDGLVVPVVRDADRKGVLELSREFGSISSRARDGKLSPTDMSGGTFTISSLGGIGGTAFTPIVNAPEVAILGVVRSRTVPVWNGAEFIPRLVLPISLSYDHRVIDGALAARFSRKLCQRLEDVRRLIL
ncbi:2-oxo acid dehydrogenase subunit E2 [Flexivirga oryzae]|uniref:Dihydrolipoamide acetyltransferase component of pyruvate dehydrogenase complex n=1 Tax=Flexivirga oryzae TaxID=1794944 RepID=A0A839N7A7_9MICO|nr:2-oxo acid dehydrogenase subunit E2 [Flexivirga oryzae]MBB2892013.1 pyruvate dehydrogenase E2 component (dihydrolipoamide acetyltransferase) [Flexivirga oryzae]